MNNVKKGYSDKHFFKPNIKSDIIKKIMNDSALSQNDLADYLNCTVSSLRNKFTRDSFSLYDFIIICHVCGYSLTISSEMECNMTDIKKSIEDIYAMLQSFFHDEEVDIETCVGEALDIAEYADDQLNLYDTVFDFSLENILTKEECQRIRSLEEKKQNEKYNHIINHLSEDEQKAMYEILKAKQESINE